MGLRRTKVGILTFSDGRRHVHEKLKELNQRLVQSLTSTGLVEVVAGREIVWTPEGARREGRRLQEHGVDLSIYQGWMVMEPFLFPGGQVGRDIRVWRDVGKGMDRDREAARAVRFMRDRLAEAA